MSKIPYQTETITGFLAPMDKDPFPKWFHIMELRPQGTFYRGQLLLQQKEWFADQGPIARYAPYLGNVVELWYDGFE